MLGHLRDTRRALVSAQWWAAFVRPVIETGFVLTFCAVVVFLWTQEDLAADLPLVGVFSAAAFRLMPVVSGVGRQWVLLISKQPSVRSVVRALNDRNREVSGSVVFSELERGVRFEAVNYTFSGRASTLNDISLDVEKGRRTVLVGGSGAGKSTIVALLLGFIRPEAGRIQVDDVDLSELQLVGWRSAIGYVGQDAFIFQGSLAENIFLGRVEENDRRIREVAEVVGLHEFIETLPDSYATLVGERGMQLSGGQRQRVSLARAILERPDILVLDEAVSALDNESAAKAIHDIDEYLPDATWFVVAHRLGTTVDFDSILVLDNGRVIEQGKHAELMSLRGYYYRLYQTEARSAVSA